MDASVQLQLVAVFILSVLALSGSALDCYQCNVECRNATQGCQDKTTEEYPDGSNSTRVSCETPGDSTGCSACMKVRTGYRRYSGRGEFEENEVVSLLCHKGEVPYTTDKCLKRGPSWALDVVCYCFSDYCNSASQQYAFAIPLISLILYALI